MESHKLAHYFLHLYGRDRLRVSNKKYILDWVKDFLDGKTPEEAGLSDGDLKKLLNCYENNVSPLETHFQSLPACACNICRT